MKMFFLQQKSDGSGRVIIVTLAMVLMFVLGETMVWAQDEDMPGGRPRSRPRGGADRGMMGMPGQGQDVSQAAEEVQTIATQILERVVANQPLSAGDVEAIKGLLKEPERHKAMFSKDDRVNLDLIYIYLSHYSGEEAQQILEQIRKARRLVQDNKDLNESAIVLGLYYEDYELVKEVLAEVGPPSLAEIQKELQKQMGGEAPAAVADIAKKMAVAGDPNAASSQGAEAETASEATSKWGTGGGSKRSEYREQGPFIGPPMMGPMTPADPMMMQPGYGPGSADRAPVRSKGARGRGDAPRVGGILNLPVQYMPYDYLGQDFDRLTLRNVNGSYFYYSPQEGQLLCALMWIMPEGAGQQAVAAPRGRSPMMPGMMPEMGPGMMGPGMMPPPEPAQRRGRDRSKGRRSDRQDTPVGSEAAFDLDTNAEQFGELFTEGIVTGKISYLGVCLNPGWQKPQVLNFLQEQTWSWATAMVQDETNLGRWQIASAVNPVMVLVDSKGKIRYMGPVGGFLPRLLIERELPHAAAAGAQIPEGLSTMGSGSAGEQGKGLFGKLFGGSGSEKAPASQTQQNAAPDPLKPKESNPHAQQMIETARKLSSGHLSPRQPLRMCDDVLERYPDSLEADEAKLLIKSILQNNPSLRTEREKQGKYVGG